MDCAFEAAPPPRAPVDLLLAIPRPNSLLKLLPEVAALGVDRLVLLRTWRVQRPYVTARALEPEIYRPLLHEGLMQGRSTREPRVTVEPLFKPFVEDRLPALVAGARALVAHPAAATDLAGVRVAAGERVVLAIGPEGGFIPYEVEALERAGFLPVTIGARTLRVETACVALLAQVDLLRRISLP
jgi:RsmE family RNA methyltransferase